MDASGNKSEIGGESITPIRQGQGKTHSKDTASLIRDLKKATRSKPRSTARKWTTRRSVDCKSPASCSSMTKITSSSSKSVFLHDWWLIKADGKGLIIGGCADIHERKTHFRSAVIVKRRDATTLETEDGMTIRISAKINRHHTLGNRFSIEVLNRFMLGFPCDWEEYSSDSSDKPNSCPVKNILPTSFDQVPVRNIRNLVSTLGANESALMLKNIYEDVQRHLGKTPSQLHPERASVDLTDHQKYQTTNATGKGGGVDDTTTQTEQKLSEGHQVHETNGQTSGAATKAVEEEQAADKKRNAAAKNIVVSRRRVLTRSVTKVKMLKNEVTDTIFHSLP